MSLSNHPIVFGQQRLSIEDIVAIAQHDVKVSLSDNHDFVEKIDVQTSFW